MIEILGKNYDLQSMMEFLLKQGQRGAKVLQALGKHKAFVDALSTDVGQLLLRDVVSMHEELLGKIASLEATDQEKAEYKGYCAIIERWDGILSNYRRILEEVEKKSAQNK